MLAAVVGTDVCNVTLLNCCRTATVVILVVLVVTAVSVAIVCGVVETAAILFALMLALP